MKNNIGHFTHEVNALDHRKFLILRAFYGGEKGWAMEARFWGLNCLIGDAEGCRLDTAKKGEKARIGRALELSLKEVDEFLTVLEVEAELLHNEGGIIWTDQTQEDLGRAMSVRIESKNRRNGRNGRQPDVKEEKTAVETETTADKTHGAERRGEERSNTRASEHTTSAEPSPVENSQESGAIESPARPPLLRDQIQEKINAAPWPITFSASEAAFLAVRLVAFCADAGFVDYAIDRVSRQNPSNPPGLLIAGLTRYDEWIHEYIKGKEREKDRDARAPPVIPPPPPCSCGGESGVRFSLRIDEGKCKDCGAWFEWNYEHGSWVEDRALCGDRIADRVDVGG
jgi:hypothetical protein